MCIFTLFNVWLNKPLHIVEHIFYKRDIDFVEFFFLLFISSVRTLAVFNIWHELRIYKVFSELISFFDDKSHFFSCACRNDLNVVCLYLKIFNEDLNIYFVCLQSDALSDFFFSMHTHFFTSWMFDRAVIIRQFSGNLTHSASALVYFIYFRDAKV